MGSKRFLAPVSRQVAGKALRIGSAGSSDLAWTAFFAARLAVAHLVPDHWLCLNGFVWWRAPHFSKTAKKGLAVTTKPLCPACRAMAVRPGVMESRSRSVEMSYGNCCSKPVA